uniref:Phage minor structural protein, N-terminal domain protein n=1 Tax=Staphylococcus aureus TaxID=1280 RepID=A0A0U5B4G5_STAAU|nr:phage minor structural protein, N-terminal domain protein [Staphylococcus aureus]
MYLEQSKRSLYARSVQQYKLIGSYHHRQEKLVKTYSKKTISMDGYTEIECIASYLADITTAKPYAPGKFEKKTTSEALKRCVERYRLGSF